MPTTSATYEERFLSKILVSDDGCWYWTAAVDRNGYAVFTFQKKKIHAHRWAYQHFVAPIPESLVVDHRCNHRSCVNPEHLKVCTQKENTLRSLIAPAAINARKTSCKHGHVLKDANLYITPNGRRQCRRCNALRTRKHRLAASV